MPPASPLTHSSCGSKNKTMQRKKPDTHPKLFTSRMCIPPELGWKTTADTVTQWHHTASSLSLSVLDGKEILGGGGGGVNGDSSGEPNANITRTVHHHHHVPQHCLAAVQSLEEDWQAAIELWKTRLQKEENLNELQREREVEEEKNRQKEGRRLQEERTMRLEADIDKWQEDDEAEFGDDQGIMLQQTVLGRSTRRQDMSSEYSIKRGSFCGAAAGRPASAMQRKNSSSKANASSSGTSHTSTGKNPTNGPGNSSQGPPAAAAAAAAGGTSSGSSQQHQAPKRPQSAPTYRRQQQGGNTSSSSDRENGFGGGDTGSSGFTFAASQSSWATSDTMPSFGPPGTSKRKSSFSSYNGGSNSKIERLDLVDDIPRGSIPIHVFTAHIAACQHHREGRLRDAVGLFSCVLQDITHADPLYPRVLANRACSYFAQREYQACLEDSLKSMDLDKTLVINYARAARCYLLLFNIRQAKAMHQQLQSKSEFFDASGDIEACEAVEDYRKAVGEKDYETALLHASHAAMIIPCLTFELLRIECLAHCRIEEAQDEVIALLQEYPDPELHYLRGQLMYKQCTDPISLGSCQQHLLKAISMAVDREHEKAKKLLNLLKKIDQHRSAATTAMSIRRYKTVVAEYSELLKLDLDNDRLVACFLIQRALASNLLEAYNDAITDTTHALGLNASLSSVQEAQALGARAEAYCGIRHYERAIQDAEAAYKLNPSLDLFEKLSLYRKHRADMFERYRKQQEQSNRREAEEREEEEARSYKNFSGGKDSGGTDSTQRKGRGSSSGFGRNPSVPSATNPTTLYDVLGVPRDVDNSRLVRAYRVCALRWHPDKWVTHGDKEKKMAEEKFKAISHAYGVLSQEATRRSYDLTLGK